MYVSFIPVRYEKGGPAALADGSHRPKGTVNPLLRNWYRVDKPFRVVGRHDEGRDDGHRRENREGG